MQYVAPKQKRYRSQFPPNLAPTASTFGLKTTSKPVCSNLSGKFNLEGGAHSAAAAGGTMGAAKGTLKPDSTNFRKKATGNPILIDKKQVNKTMREGPRKAAVPKKDEKPIHGLVSDKNFIVANAVENILAAPKLPASKESDMLKKKTYGKVPKYVQKIKKEIDDEYNLVRELQIEEQNERDRQKMLMPEEERQELIAGLKRKWESLMLAYQKESHHGKLDTIGKKSRKEVIEADMDQVEADIKKLQKNYIFVDTTAPSTMF